MDTNATTATAASATGATTTRTPTKSIDKDAFLMLLVAQLKNQDPNSAQDTNAMVQQMTGFATLEQMQNSNSLLEGIQVQNHGLFQAQAANMVGKKVRVLSNIIDLKDNKATIGLDLEAAAKVSVVIKDKNGKVVATLDKGEMGQGNHTIDWAGTGVDGNKLEDGQYTVEITAKDAEGKDVKTQTSAYTRVDSVLFAEGTIYVFAGGKRYVLSDITEIAA